LHELPIAKKGITDIFDRHQDGQILNEEIGCEYNEDRKMLSRKKKQKVEGGMSREDRLGRRQGRGAKKVRKEGSEKLSRGEKNIFSALGRSTSNLLLPEKRPCW